eukprot:3547995-Prorocentrum_lima.AAC.1
MTSSLVGSEMCIRDSDKPNVELQFVLAYFTKSASGKYAYRYLTVGNDAVSYTHLTLPTICSV